MSDWSNHKAREEWMRDEHRRTVALMREFHTRRSALDATAEDWGMSELLGELDARTPGDE